MSVLEDDSYRQVRKLLVEDDIVKAMAAEIITGPEEMKNLIHRDGTPRHEFIGAANNEYDRRGGEISNRHIGAVAEAILVIARGELA
jgi:hypothetical protein